MGIIGNAIVGQSGGPTAAINATLAGVIMGVLVLAAGAIGSVGMLIISALGVNDIARGCAPAVIAVPRALYIYVVPCSRTVYLTVLGV